MESRKRPREDRFDLLGKKYEPVDFIEAMRTAHRDGRIPVFLDAVSNASDHLRAVIAGESGLKRIRQWLQELLAGTKADAAAVSPLSPSNASLVVRILRAIESLPIRSQDVFVRSKISDIVWRILNRQFVVPTECQEAATSLLSRWATSDGEPAAVPGVPSRVIQPAPPLKTSTRSAAPSSSSSSSTSQASSAAARPATKALASSSTSNEEDGIALEDVDLPAASSLSEALPSVVSFHDSMPSSSKPSRRREKSRNSSSSSSSSNNNNSSSDVDYASGIDSPASSAIPSPASMKSLEEGIESLSSLVLDPSSEATSEEEADHRFFDGKPEAFGKVPNGVLINRKLRLVGGRPWATFAEALGSDKPSGKRARLASRVESVDQSDAKDEAAEAAAVPEAAVEAKRRRARGIVFEEPERLERVRFFISKASPRGVARGDPTEDDWQRAMQESQEGDEEEDGSADEEDHLDAAEARRREEEREKAFNLRRRLGRGEGDEAASDEAAFPTSHFHLPPPPLLIAAELRPAACPSSDRQLNRKETEAVPAFAERHVASVSELPKLSSRVWAGYTTGSRPANFPAPPLRAKGGNQRTARLSGLLARLSAPGSRVAGASASETRDASLSRRSASPGTLLGHTAAPVASAVSGTPAAASSSVLSGLSSLMRRVSAPRQASDPARSASASYGRAGTTTSAMHYGGVGQQQGVGTHYNHGGVPSAPLSSSSSAAPQHPPGAYHSPAAFGVDHPAAAAIFHQARTMPLPPVNVYQREPGDPAEWWQLLPEELDRPINRPEGSNCCHFYSTIQGCARQSNCKFRHDPNYVVRKAPKGVDRLWEFFIRIVHPHRRVRRIAGRSPAPPHAFPVSQLPPVDVFIAAGHAGGSAAPASAPRPPMTSGYAHAPPGGYGGASSSAGYGRAPLPGGYGSSTVPGGYGPRPGYGYGGGGPPSAAAFASQQQQGGRSASAGRQYGSYPQPPNQQHRQHYQQQQQQQQPFRGPAYGGRPPPPQHSAGGYDRSRPRY